MHCFQISFICGFSLGLELLDTEPEDKFAMSVDLGIIRIVYYITDSQ